MNTLILICGLARAAVVAEYGPPSICVDTPRGETCSWSSRAPSRDLLFVQYCGSAVCGAWEWRALDRRVVLDCQVTP